MNFALILFVLTVLTGGAWLADKLVFEGRRRARARDAVENFDRQRLGDAGTVQRVAVESAALKEPSWVEYSKAFFPVLLIVFLLRSFLAEPFKIPSSSMRPTLEVGDFILVNKFVYGIRLPIIEQKIISLSDPQRGDVVVFRYPVNPSQDFIKRVIGVGGDVVEYRDKQLRVNGQPWPQKTDGTYSYLEGMRFDTLERKFETTADPAGREHTIGLNPQAQPVYPLNVRQFPGRDNCDYNERGFTCKVPAGQYLMMGDNRDNSDDSRYWGFVPDDHIRGKAFFIWFNWDDIASFAFKRVGSGIR
ncbi:MAG TPA: signal peptidase I [Casimicrobiaceae bacterium]|nr:signal peptidase I [Casimicrobiaceae bacterium]